MDIERKKTMDSEIKERHRIIALERKERDRIIQENTERSKGKERTTRPKEREEWTFGGGGQGARPLLEKVNPLAAHRTIFMVVIIIFRFSS